MYTPITVKTHAHNQVKNLQNVTSILSLHRKWASEPNGLPHIVLLPFLLADWRKGWVGDVAAGQGASTSSLTEASLSTEALRTSCVLLNSIALQSVCRSALGWSVFYSGRWVWRGGVYIRGLTVGPEASAPFSSSVFSLLRGGVRTPEGTGQLLGCFRSTLW